VTATLVAGLQLPRFRRISVEPISGACGCEIGGVDLSQPLPPEVLSEVMTAFEHFLVIVFRDQNLTPEQHKAFSRYFGEITGRRRRRSWGDHDMQRSARGGRAGERRAVLRELPHRQPACCSRPSASSCVRSTPTLRR
jgi:taurine dioxygenase